MAIAREAERFQKNGSRLKGRGKRGSSEGICSCFSGKRSGERISTFRTSSSRKGTRSGSAEWARRRSRADATKEVGRLGAEGICGSSSNATWSSSSVDAKEASRLPEASSSGMLAFRKYVPFLTGTGSFWLYWLSNMVAPR